MTKSPIKGPGQKVRRVELGVEGKRKYCSFPEGASPYQKKVDTQRGLGDQAAKPAGEELYKQHK
jgi:hypothetical protein